MTYRDGRGLTVTVRLALAALAVVAPVVPVLSRPSCSQTVEHPGEQLVTCASHVWQVDTSDGRTRVEVLR